MELIRATEREADELLAFYRHVADNMEEKGLQHWHWGRYPNEEMIRGDIEKGELFYMREGSVLAAAVVFIILGVMNCSMKDVLVKAIKICTECVGLG